MLTNIRSISKSMLCRHSHVATWLHMLSYVPIWSCCQNLSLILHSFKTSSNNLIKFFQKLNSVMKNKYSPLQIIYFSVNISRSVSIFEFLQEATSDTWCELFLNLFFTWRINEWKAQVSVNYVAILLITKPLINHLFLWRPNFIPENGLSCT